MHHSVHGPLPVSDNAEAQLLLYFLLNLWPEKTKVPEERNLFFDCA
jgi:hypothetical protein